MVFESVTSTYGFSLRAAFLAAMMFAPPGEGAAVDGRAKSESGRGGRTKETMGEFGGDLGLLKRAYTPPSVAGESNHYFDLWEPGALASFARVQGLTNNRALFIDSHGSERFSWKGTKYVFRPGAAVAKGQHVSSYSIQDFYHLVGTEAAAGIHNVLVAGCNLEGSLRAADVRRYFPHATNVTYMAAGRLAYKQVFYQVLTEHSEDIRPLYGRVVEKGEAIRASISREPVAGAKPLGTYVAELFVPGASKSYRTQVAGRELLDPSFRPSNGLRADNRFRVAWP